ncbi:MAG TPA: pyruvate kinase [Gemmatimonadaceae bacterium]|nr:pyruvate kinase [Gemmatimonadaceae bacterium]
MSSNSRIPRTKIVCTLGPATSTPEAIAALMDAGLNVARINFSHGTHEQHARTIALVRQLAAERERPVAILGDLQGPRIRMGDLAAPVTVQAGEDLVLCFEDEAAAGELPVTYEHIADDVRVGDRILVDDGLIELVVLEVNKPRITARVVYGGMIRSHKGLNLPGVAVSAPSITDKDRADAQFAVEQGLDYIALSFVRRAEDIAQLRSMLPKGMLIVAKIEKDTALANIEGILRAADAVMVARGDLGVELPFEEVPLVQKRIIRLAGQLGRPVITATQMLESMIHNPRPTRAEASDVANAILDGTDAVMLSAETASGSYPRLAVQAMQRIIAEIEHHQPPRREERRNALGTATTEETIAAAVVTAVRMLGTRLVIVFTKSGFSARMVSSHRPGVPIFALTDAPKTFNQLALVWGVVPLLVPPADTYEKMLDSARRALVQRGLASEGDKVIVTAGVPFDVPGTTNLLKVETV